jgi:acetate kinase
MRVLVLNSGSSSIKYEVIDTSSEEVLLRGMVDRIGAGGAILTQRRHADDRKVKEAIPGARHADAFESLLGKVLDPEAGLGADAEVDAVGHRVVHGGERFKGSTLIDEEVLEGIRDCMELAPLHNPHNLHGIEAARQALPELPHVAVFDTAFHASLEPHAYLYGLPYALYRRHGIRRYGFHGTSHRNVGRRVAGLLGRPPEELRIISLHLGNGASACAIREGRSVETSMGFTPLEGLVMGTRSGDVDPAALLHVMARDGLSVGDVNTLLNRHSGLQGISGISGDMRDLLGEEARGEPRAQLALQVYIHRIRKYVGAYAAVLGGVDALAFTGGVGENAETIRARVAEGLAFLGMEVDPEANRSLVGGKEGTFHRGSTALLVIRSGEELTIARETARILNGA